MEITDQYTLYFGAQNVAYHGHHREHRQPGKLEWTDDRLCESVFSSWIPGGGRFYSEMNEHRGTGCCSVQVLMEWCFICILIIRVHYCFCPPRSPISSPVILVSCQ